MTLQDMPYYDKKVLLVDDHDTDDIIDAIRTRSRKFQRDYEKNAPAFWAGNAKDTARKIYGFLKSNVRYDIEPENSQTVKSPGAIIGQGYGDCKHYASFVNGICQALKKEGYPIDSYFKFVSDDKSREIHHVFGVVQDPATGREYWADPVPEVSRFNARPTFYNEKNLNMAVYEISGLGRKNDNPGNLPMVGERGYYKGGPGNLPMVGKKKKGGFFHNLAHGLAVDVHNTAKGAGQALKKVESVVLKVDMAPARNAALALFDINAFNMAERAAAGNLSGLKNKWREIGGDPGKLINAINNGLKHAHINKRVSGIGDAAVPFDPYGTAPYTTSYTTPQPPASAMPSAPTSSGTPAHTNALAALANKIISLIEGYFGLPQKALFSTQQINQAVTAGTQAIIQGAAGMGLPPSVTGAMNQVLGGAGITGSMDANGNPTVSVSPGNSPVLNSAGSSGGGAGAALAALPPAGQTTSDTSATPSVPGTMDLGVTPPASGGPSGQMGPMSAPGGSGPSGPMSALPPAGQIDTSATPSEAPAKKSGDTLKDIESFFKEHKVEIGAAALAFYLLAVGKTSVFKLIK